MEDDDIIEIVALIQDISVVDLFTGLCYKQGYTPARTQSLLTGYIQEDFVPEFMEKWCLDFLKGEHHAMG